MNFEELVKNRYAVKLFDKKKKIAAEDLHYVLDMAILAPTSFGLQPFRIKVVEDAALKKKLEEVSWNQPQISSCSHLLVFCADNDVLQRIKSYGGLMHAAGVPAEKKDMYLGIMHGTFKEKSPEEMTAWAARQAYIAADHAMLAAVERGFNSCPMEGFDAKRYSEILHLPKNLHPVILVPLGYPADEKRPKLRFPKEDVVL